MNQANRGKLISISTRQQQRALTAEPDQEYKLEGVMFTATPSKRG